MAESLNINISNLIVNGDATKVIALVPATNVKIAPNRAETKGTMKLC